MNEWFNSEQNSNRQAHRLVALNKGSGQIDGEWMSYEDVMRDVYVLIQSCFGFKINPLRYLRRYFPDYEWKYFGFEGYFGPGDFSDTGFPVALKVAQYIWVFSDFAVYASPKNGKKEMPSVLLMGEYTIISDNWDMFERHKAMMVSERK